MPHCITAFCDTGSDSQLIMTWGATCLGLASTSRRLNGSTITPDMLIVGFRDNGYRCNGGTKLTSIILDTWGPDFGKIMSSSNARAFIEKVAVPSRSYAQTIARLNGWRLDGSIGTPLAMLHGVAHITGGGVWSKLGEILPEGVGAYLSSMPRPDPVLIQAQALASRTSSPLTGYQCHGTFHGGCGLMIVCEDRDADRVLQEACNDGHDPYIVGRTIESENREISIDSRFFGEVRLSSLCPN